MDFRAAMVAASELITQSQNDAGAMTAERLAPFFRDEEGTRGFFVAFLTREGYDETPEVLVETLRRCPAPAFSVLVRNLVMSSATEASHRRTGELEKAGQSARVCRRTAELIARIDDQSMWQTLAHMRKSLIGESDSFAEFLARVHYSDDEKLAALAAVENVLSHHKPCEPDASLDLKNPFQ